MARARVYKHHDHHSFRHQWEGWSLLQWATLIYSLLILTLLVVFYVCAVGELLPHDPEELALDQLLAKPFTPGYILGTDYLGRDILTRLMLGTEAYFLPGLLAVSIAIIFGGILGSITVYSSRNGKKTINIFNNTLQSMPRLVVLFLFIAIFEPDIYLIMIIIGVSHIPAIAKVVNNRILVLQEKSFIDSAIASGLSSFTILFKHILWYNCRGLLLAQASLIMSEAILMETSLSYLGFGVQEPEASWGNMIQSGASYLLQGDIWSSTIPAVAVMLVLSAFFLLSNLIINKLDRK